MEYSDRYLDDLIRGVLFKRMPICMNCGCKEFLTPAHIIRRGNHSLRWDILNLVTLCINCHNFFNDDEAAWDIWWRSHFPERITYLESRKNIIFDGDRELIYKYIKNL